MERNYFIDLGNDYSRGNTIESYNFVWHNVLGGLLYKQGILFFLLVIFFTFYQKRKLNTINNYNIKKSNSLLTIKMDWLLIQSLPYLLSPGILKEALILGFVLSFYQYELNLKTQNSF